MIEILPKCNIKEDSYCNCCGARRVPTWNVSLSWKGSEELCEDCLNELYNKLSDTLMGIQIKKDVEKGGGIS